MDLLSASTTDRAFLVQLHAGLLQPEPIRIGPPADREHHRVRLDRVAAVHVDEQAAILALLDALERSVETEVDSLHHRDGEQPVADRLVIAAQDHVAAVDQGHVAAELMEDAGEFIGDIAGAGDDDALRQLLEVERLVRGDAELRARESSGTTGVAPLAIRMVRAVTLRPLPRRMSCGPVERRRAP